MSTHVVLSSIIIGIINISSINFSKLLLKLKHTYTLHLFKIFCKENMMWLISMACLQLTSATISSRLDGNIKGQCHKIFCFRFASWIIFPKIPENNKWGSFRIFFENSRRYWRKKFIYMLTLLPIGVKTK